MAITRGNFSSATGTTSISISAPSGTALNDVMVIFFCDKATSGTITPPTGWTSITSAAGASGRMTICVGSYGYNSIGTGPWTFNGTTSSVGYIITYSGVSPSAPVVSNSATYNASGTYGTTSINTSATNQMVVAAFCLFFGATWSAESVTNPTITEFIDSNLNTSFDVAVCDGIKASAGATGASTATPALAGANVCILIALAEIVQINVTGLASSATIGASSSTQAGITATGLASSGAFGSGTIQSIITAIGLASAESFGTPSGLSTNINAMSLDSSEAFGLSNFGMVMSIIGIPSSEVFGIPQHIFLRAFSLVKYGLIKYNTSIHNMPLGEYTKDVIPPTPYS